MSDELSGFEAHLERVLLVSQVALAVHRVTHPGCEDFGHLTALDQRRAQAALEAVEAALGSRPTGEGE